MQSEKIVQESVMFESKPNPLDIISPYTKQIQVLDDKSNISQNVSSNSTDRSVLGKRLCTERGSSNNPMAVSRDRSLLSSAQQNISASCSNKPNTSYEEERADGAHIQALEAIKLA